MKSIAHQHLIPQVEKAIQTVLCEAPERLSRSSGLVIRKRKVTGPLLAQTLILGWLRNPSAGMEELAQQAAEVGLEITATGLEERMTRRTATFLLALLEVAFGQVVMADPVSVDLLNRFEAVCLEDSTTLALPAQLADLFRGNGGKASPAACKLFARWDLVRGQLTCSRLQDGRCADGASPLKAVAMPARTLHIRDRGFTDVGRWEQEGQRQEWVLTYVRAGVLLTREDGTPLDLLTVLPRLGDRGELRVLVGRQGLPMRLVFERVPEEVAAYRRRKLQAEHQERGQVLSSRVSALADWSIAVTTVPDDMLSWQEAVVLLRLRWQIELLFKLWKHEGKWDVWRTSNPNRILCELLAKLLGLLIQHWMLILGCWHDPHRSLVKAAKAFRQQIALLSTALAGEWSLTEALTRMLHVIGTSARLTRRADAPASSQLLVAGTNRWPSTPPRPWRRYRKSKAWKPPARNTRGSS